MKKHNPIADKLLFYLIISLTLLSCRLSRSGVFVAPDPTVTAPPTSSPTEPHPTAEYQTQTSVNPIDGAVLVFVPEGAFVMGENRYERTIFLDPFWFYQVPVTNSQFAEFVSQTGYQTTAEIQGFSLAFVGINYQKVTGASWSMPSGIGSDISGLDDHPVGHMSWEDARSYCEWAGGQLPTDAEWVKAGRGTDGRIYPWGNDPVTGDKANFCDINCPDPQHPGFEDASHDDGYAFTSPVGNYPAGASPYGALDMAGNILEWIADWYDPIYYINAPDQNPTGPQSGSARVQRGGYYGSPDYDLALSREPSAQAPDYPVYYYGFRCVLSERP